MPHTPITAGYRAFNGYVFTATDAAAYNAECERVARWERAGRPVPEHLANGRHHLFAVLCGAAPHPARANA